MEGRRQVSGRICLGVILKDHARQIEFSPWLVLARFGSGSLPLRQIVGDHACRFHRGLAELGVAGEFALDALAFVVHQRAQSFELRDQIFDFAERCARDAVDQRVDA